jgi:hypothetical protein
MMRRRAALLRRIFVVLLCGAVLAPGAVLGQQRDRYYYEMRDKLLRAASVFARTGYELSHDPYVQIFRDRTSREFTLLMEARRSYAIVAVGDDDAIDIDLELYDERGRLIDQDQGREAEAIVTAVPGYAARFTVRVILRECSTQDCYVGAGVFVRR